MRYKGEVARDEYDRTPGERWSKLRHMRRSPLHYKHAIAQPDVTTDAFKIGGACHCALLEPEHFAARYTVYSESKTTGKGARTSWQEFQRANAHRIILSQDEWDRALAIAAAVRAHPAAAELLARGRAEVPLTWTDARTGIRCKARLDWGTAKHQLVEVKSTANLDAHAFANIAWKYSYFHQVHYYARGLAAQLGRNPEQIETFVIAVESAPPHDVVVYCPEDSALEAAQEEVEQILTQLALCLERDHWPGRAEQQQILSAPRYVVDSEEDDWTVTGG